MTALVHLNGSPRQVRLNRRSPKIKRTRVENDQVLFFLAHIMTLLLDKLWTFIQNLQKKISKYLERKKPCLVVFSIYS